MTNPDGTEYIGQVWPGYTVCVLHVYEYLLSFSFVQVFPDWFANNTQSWWTEALRNWTNAGVQFSGLAALLSAAIYFTD